MSSLSTSQTIATEPPFEPPAMLPVSPWRSEPSPLRQTRSRLLSASRGLSPFSSHLSEAEISLARGEANPEHDARASPPRQPSPRGYEAPAVPPTEEVTLLRLTAHYATMVPMAIFGTLIRLGMVGLATYDGRVVFPLAWAQGIGCAIMGTALGLKPELTTLYPPLYTALATGLAGSVTTFSSWMLEGYESFSNLDGYNRNGLRDTVDGLAYSFVTWSIALACIHLGVHCSRIFYPLAIISRAVSAPETESFPSAEKHWRFKTPTKSCFLDWCTIILAMLFYVGAIILYFLGPKSWRHIVTFPILLGPPGAMLRFALSKLNLLSPFVDRFPMGTFVANMLATAVLAGVYAAQRSKALALGGTTCNALYAIEEGFCGCLSTVSTFAVEARSIKGAGKKWTYVLGSITLGQVIVMAIVGGVSWSIGLQAACNG